MVSKESLCDLGVLCGCIVTTDCLNQLKEPNNSSQLSKLKKLTPIACLSLGLSYPLIEELGLVGIGISIRIRRDRCSSNFACAVMLTKLPKLRCPVFDCGCRVAEVKHSARRVR